jgi:hypothetical protein
MDLLDALVEHDPVDDIKSLVISDPGVGWFVSIARHLHERDRFAIFEHARFLFAPRAEPVPQHVSSHATPTDTPPEPAALESSSTASDADANADLQGELEATAIRHDAARRRLRGADPGAMSVSVAPGYLRAAQVGLPPSPLPGASSAACVPVRWGYGVAHADHGAIRACFWWYNADGTVREVVTSDPLEAIKDEILLRIRTALSERCGG